MGNHAQGRGVTASMQARIFWGSYCWFGLVVAALTCAADQASKAWLIRVYDLPNRGVVKVAPYIDLVMTWNTGISYGWFQQEGPVGQAALLAFKVIAVALLWLWLVRAHSRLVALSLALIIGGAIGNGIDRWTYGAVADFVLLYAQTATWRFNWYVFNLADVAIVAGVVGLAYESLLGGSAQKAP